MSPAPAVSNANEDVGQRRDVRQGVVTPPLSDILPAGHTVVPPKVMLQHGSITTFSDTRLRRSTVHVLEEEDYDAFKRYGECIASCSSTTCAQRCETTSGGGALGGGLRGVINASGWRLGVDLNQALRCGPGIGLERVRDLARAVDGLRARNGREGDIYRSGGMIFIALACSRGVGA